MARDTSVLESAARFFRKAVRPLMNQRGEITIEQPAAAPATATPAQPAVSTDVNQLPGDEYSPSLDLLPPSSTGNPTDQVPQVPQDGAPPAVALNSEMAPAQPADGQQIATDKGPIPYERFKEVNDQVATFRGELENVKRMAEFYQTQYNELVTQVQGSSGLPDPAKATQPTAQPTGADPAVKPQLPAGIKGPEEWETQGDMAAYFDHVASAKAQPLVRQEMEGVYKSAIAPQMQAINKWVGALEEMVVRAQHPDFDEVTQAVMGELFVTDHEGKIWNDPSGDPKVKNQALLNYIRQAPSPRMALYNYGAAKKAPDIKATAVKETTENLLKAIDTRPKGPTMPKQAGGGVDTDEVPPQNAPKEVVDAWLKRRGLV